MFQTEYPLPTVMTPDKSETSHLIECVIKCDSLYGVLDSSSDLLSRKAANAVQSDPISIANTECLLELLCLFCGSELLTLRKWKFAISEAAAICPPSAKQRERYPLP